MTKHTPGPWRVGLTLGSSHTSPEGPWGWYQTDIDGPPGEGCFLDLRQYHGGEVGQANAHLIAAAPELLEACRSAYPFIETIAREHAGMVGGATAAEALAALDAAIAKAEGR